MRRVHMNAIRLANRYIRTLSVAWLLLAATVAVAGEQAGQSEVATAAVQQLAKVHQAQSQADTVANVQVLEDRLKNTRAIGIFTKLAIRNDIMDLVDEIRAYRKQARLQSRLKEIRSSFDGLILKIMALLEDDPALSRDLYTNRELLWNSLLEVKA
ncbi:hypothetical protein [Mariprofundus ferrooxydans]|uniref:hypothetical protein n=1 Tax=Mariprofundus ferrooxydans TaxID=314344 RepID=UPI001E33F066|nr:hypothetical protein [Mariprofundus ferrooxydans]